MEVKALDSAHIGHVVRQTEDKLVIFGEGNERYDIPTMEINQVGANLLIGLNLQDVVILNRCTISFFTT